MGQAMGKTVDSKVVEMSFNNENFEQNAQKSISTLGQLKESLKLDGATKGFDQIDKAANSVSFDGIVAGVQQVADKFTFLGTIAKRITENIADDLYSAVKSAAAKVASLPSQAWSIITEGGKKRAFGIENAKFMLEGLFPDDLTEVKGILDNAMESVDGTAYAYDSAAQAAAQFAASGLKAGDQMYSALRAITGVAAMTNTEYENISQIFTTVAGNGRLMADQLLQLSSRGLNAAASLAKYFNGVSKGTIKASEDVTKAIKALSAGADVTESDIREFVSKGKISFDIFSEAMDSAFGDHAKKANETFTGSLANMQAALKKIGAKFYGPLIERNGPLVDLFNALRIKINEVKDAIDPLTSLLSDSVIMAVEKLTDLVNNFDFQHSGFKAFLDALAPKHLNAKDYLFGMGVDSKQMSALQKLFIETAKKHGIAVDEMIGEHQTFSDTLKKGWLTKDIYNEALGGIIDLVKGTAKGSAEATTDLEKVREAALKVIRGEYGNDMQARYAKLAEEGFDPQVVQDYVNALYKAAGGTWNLSEETYEMADAAIKAGHSIESMTDEQLANAGYTKEQIDALRELQKEAEKAGVSIEEYLAIEGKTDKKSGAELLLESLSNVMTGVSKIITPIKEAWQEVFPTSTSDIIYGVIERINEFSKKLIISDKNAEKLKATFGGVFRVFNILWKLFKAVAGPVITALGNAFGFVAQKVLNLSAKFGGWTEKLDKWLKDSGAYQKISSVLTYAFDKLGKALSFVWDVTSKFVRSGIAKLREWFDTFSKIPAVQSNLTRFKNAFKIFTKNFIPYMGEGIERIKAFIQRVKDMGGLRLDNLGAVFKDFKENVLGYFLDFPGFKAFGNAFKFLIKDIGGWLGQIGNMIWDYFKGLRERLDGTFAGKLLGFVMDSFETIRDKLAAMFNGNGEGGFSFKKLFENIIAGVSDFIGFVFKLVKKAAPIALIVGAIVGIIAIVRRVIALFTTIPMVLNTLQRTLKGMMLERRAKTFERQAGSIQKLAIALAIVAGSIYVLSKLDPARMWSAVAAIAVIGALMAALLILASKLTWQYTFAGGPFNVFENIARSITGWFESKRFVNIGKAAVLFAAAIAVLAGAVWVLGQLDTGQLKQGLIAIGLLTAMMVAVMFLMSKMNGLKIGLTGLAGIVGLIGIAASVSILVDAINKLKVDDNLLVKLLVVEVLLASLTAVALILNSAAFYGTRSIAGFAAFAAIIIGVAILVKSINKLKVDENLLAKLLVVEILLASLTIVALVLNSFAFYGTRSIAGLAAFAAIVIGVAILVKSVNELKADENVWKKLLIVEILLASLTVIALIINKASSTSVGGIAGLASFAAIIIGVAILVKSINELKVKKNIWKKLLVVEILLASLVAVVLLLNSFAFRGSRNIAGLAMFAAIIIGVAVLVRAMNSLKIDKNIVKKVLIVELLIASLAVVAVALSKFAGGAGSIRSAVSVLALAAAVYIIAEALSKLASVDPGSLDGAMKALVAIIAMVTLMAGVVGITGPSILSMLGIAALVAVIGLVLFNLAKIKPKRLESTVSSIGKFFKALSITMAVLGAVGLLGPAAMSGVVAALAFVAGLGLIVGLLGGFVGGGIAAFGKAVTSALPKMGEDLAAFGEAMRPFVDVFNSINPGAFENFKMLGESLIAIAEGEFLSAIYKLFSGGKSPITTFANEMPELARALSAYAGALDENINMDKVNASIAATQMLASLARNEIPEGGVIGWLKGNGSKISQFGNQLPDLARGLSSYANAIDSATFNQEKIEASKNLAEMLSDLTNNTIPEGGIIGWLKGNSSKISDFGTQLPELANGLAAYANTVDGATFSQDKIEASSNLAKMLASIASESIPAGGIVGWFTGNDEKIINFANQLPVLGKGLKKFVRAIGSEKFENTDAAANLAKMLGELASETIPAGGLVGWFTGNDEKITSFANQLPDLGKGLKKFSRAIGSEKFENTDAAANLAKMLAELASETIPAGGLVGWFTGNDERITNFANQLPDLGKGLKKFARAIGSEKFENTDAAGNLAKMLAELASESIPAGGIVGWFTGNDEKITNFATQLPSLGEGLKKFAEKIGDEKFENTEAAGNLAKMLGELASESIPAGGIIGWFTGNDEKIANFATQLPDLGAGLAGFATAIGDQTFDNVSAATGLVETLAALASEDIGAGGVIGFLTGTGDKITNFATQLPDLGEGIKAFAEKIGDEKFENTDAAAGLAKMIAELAGEDIGAGGVIGFLSGTGDKITNFAKQLPDLGEGIKAFAEKIGNEKFENTEAAAGIADMIAKMAGEDIGAGGIIGFLTGSGDKVTNFAKQLPDLGEGMKGFAEKIGNEKFENSETAANLAKMIAEMSNESIGSGGIIGWLTGEGSKITDFATQLPDLGTGLAGFANAIKDVTFTSADQAGNLAGTLAAMSSDHIGTGGIIGWLTGEGSKITDFAKQLPDLGEGLSGFAQKLTDDVLNTDKIEAAGSAFNTLGSVSEKISAFALLDLNHLGSGFDENLSAIGRALEAFDQNYIYDPKKINSVANVLKGLSGFTDESIGVIGDDVAESFSSNMQKIVDTINSLTGIDETGVDKYKKAIDDINNTEIKTNLDEKSITKETANATKASTDAMSSTIKQSSSSVSAAASSVMSGVASVLGDTSGFINSGIAIIAAVASGMMQSSAMSDNARALAQGAANAMKDVDTSSAGYNFVSGFAHGIANHSIISEAAARAMARNALNAAKQEMKSNSPSKETYKLGTFFGQGFGNAIRDYTGTVSKVAGNMSREALSAMNGTIATLGRLFEQDIDAQPVITPVLDLSEIQNGALTIGDLLTFNDPIGVTGNMNAISANLSGRGKASADDIVNALGMLQTTLAEKPEGNTYIVDGVTYDDGSNITSAVRTLINAVNVQNRVQ